MLDDVLSGGDPAELGAIAAALLLQTDLVVAGRRHAILELEFYASSPSHPDPFAHGEAPQRTNGRWYFHRRSGSYRGGSFKGLDVTFGPVGDVGGILIRTLEAPDGARINGPSLCVDHLLERTGAASVAALDEALGASKVWAARGPLRLAWRARPRDAEVVSTARAWA